MKKIIFLLLVNCIAFAVLSQDVGINNTLPKYALDILKPGGGYMLRLVNPSTTTGSSSGLLFTNTTAYNTTNQHYSASILAERQAAGGNVLTFSNNPTSGALIERMRIDTAGNIGIGTTFPFYDLHIERTNPSIGFFDVDDNHYSGQIDGDSTDLLINAYSKPNTPDGAGNLILQANRSNGFITSFAGNVGIGTADPSAKLHVRTNVLIGAGLPASGYLLSVRGKIISEEVRVELNASWPDYVFEKNYRLPSLKYLEQYIQTNKHLPNIPSAAQVQKEGFDLGDMNRRLLEKIEEMVLYAIEQNKKLEILQKEVNALKAKLK